MAYTMDRTRVIILNNIIDLYGIQRHKVLANGKIKIA